MRFRSPDHKRPTANEKSTHVRACVRAFVHTYIYISWEGIGTPLRFTSRPVPGPIYIDTDVSIRSSWLRASVSLLPLFLSPHPTLPVLLRSSGSGPSACRVRSHGAPIKAVLP